MVKYIEKFKEQEHTYGTCDGTIFIKQEEKTMFKIGDKVKVVKKVTEKTEDFQNSWVDEMDKYIGSICTVDGVFSKSGVSIEEAEYIFPPASLVLVKESVEEQKDDKFTSLNNLLYYLADGNMILCSNHCLYKIDDSVLKYKEVGSSVWQYCDTNLADYGFYTKAGKPEVDWYEKEFKPCLCYVWDEDESKSTRVAIVEAYDKYEDYPFQTSGDWFKFAQPLTLAEVTLYCLECE